MGDTVKADIVTICMHKMKNKRAAQFLRADNADQRQIKDAHGF